MGLDPRRGHNGEGVVRGGVLSTEDHVPRGLHLNLTRLRSFLSTPVPGPCSTHYSLPILATRTLLPTEEDNFGHVHPVSSPSVPLSRLPSSSPPTSHGSSRVPHPVLASSEEPLYVEVGSRVEERWRTTVLLDGRRVRAESAPSSLPPSSFDTEGDGEGVSTSLPRTPTQESRPRPPIPCRSPRSHGSLGVVHGVGG